MYFAHSGKRQDKSDWQTLAEHLTRVSHIAAGFGEMLGLGNAAAIAGLFHDLGKYTETFQLRLEGASITVDHSTAGAKLLIDLTQGRDRAIAELIAYGIAGHHAGLPDKLGEASLSDRLSRFAGSVDPSWKHELSPKISGLVPDLQFGKAHAGFQFAFLGRMIFSCLVDADFKDTEAFYSKLDGSIIERQWPALRPLLPQFAQAFDSHMLQMPATDTTVNRLRRKILEHVRGKAAEKPGLFTLTVPTGGGKTLASLGFALDHARHHGLDRIIYAIPFTSIIDQIASIFKSILGKAHVLEHHSAIEEDRFLPKEANDKLRLAMEDWAAPVVVTTNVQFFESLFAARPGRARKLHNIARSVIILDEAQTIPRKLLSPCARAIDELARNYGCTIVLCTATQPALDMRNFHGGHPAGLPLEGRELAPEPEKLASALRRVTLHRAGTMSNDDLLAALQQTPQALLIVNSRKHALDLYRAAQAQGMPDVVHLTTRQYAAHRRRILDDIRSRLVGGRPCRLIATSLVEAGVDLDFPRVWRAEAGLDQITQAAGRCNREGRRPIEDSAVTIFTPSEDYPSPAEITGLISDMVRMAGKHADLLSPAAIADYFGEVYWRHGPEGLDGKKILDRFKIDANGTDFAYRSVAADFQMIESGMLPVIVAREEVARETVRKFEVPDIPSGTIARALQTYIVQVPPKARERLIANGRTAYVRPDLRGDQFAVLNDLSLYSEEVGLNWEDAEYLTSII